MDGGGGCRGERRGAVPLRSAQMMGQQTNKQTNKKQNKTKNKKQKQKTKEEEEEENRAVLWSTCLTLFGLRVTLSVSGSPYSDRGHYLNFSPKNDDVTAKKKNKKNKTKQQQQ